MDNGDARRIEQYVEGKINPLQHAIALAQESAKVVQQKAALDELEKNRNALVEINSRTFDKAQTYTTVIIAGAYAALFTIWSKSDEALSHRASAVIAICLTVSVMAFVLFEIFGIGIRTFNLLRFRKEVRAANTPEQYAAYLKELNTREARIGLRFAPWYALSLLLTLAPAFVSSSLLVYNNLANLLHWPSWPS